jgi:hypothetical protein
VLDLLFLILDIGQWNIKRFLIARLLALYRLATIFRKEYLVLIATFVEHYKIDTVDSPTSIPLVSLEHIGGGLLMSRNGSCLIG